MHGARSDVPPGVNDAPGSGKKDSLTPARRSVCNDCADAVDVEDRFTLRVKVLADALRRSDELSDPEPEQIVLPPDAQDDELATAA